MALRPIIVADGNIAALLERGRVAITAQLVLADDVFDDAQPPVLVKSASQAACEEVAATMNVDLWQLSAVEFPDMRTFAGQAAPRVFTTAEIEIDIPPGTPDPV